MNRHRFNVVMNTEFIPIVPRSGLYLQRYGEAQETRFAGLFRDTWRRLPLWARRSMLKQWRRRSPTEVVGAPPGFVWHTPTIQCVEWSENLWMDDGANALGACGLAGTSLTFWSKAVAVMPDSIVCELIAHELGHVFLRAAGVPLDNFTEEFEVEELLYHSWGCDPDARDKWKHENRELFVSLDREETAA